jgi:hypothetical protein
MGNPKGLKGEVDGFRKTKPQPAPKPQVKPEPKVAPKRSWGLVEDVINALNKAKDNREALAEIGRDFGIEYKGDYEVFNTAVVTKARKIL